MKNRWLKNRSKKMGLPPGSVVHIGDATNSPTQISVFQYTDDKISEIHSASIEDIISQKKIPGQIWVDVDGISDVKLISEVAKLMGFHHLMTEDIVNSDQRAKVDVYDNCLFIVLKMLTYNKQANIINSEQVSIVVGKGWVFTFQESKPGDVWHGVRESMRHKRGHIRHRKSDFLAYSLIDAVVDSLFIILEDFCERIEVDENDSLVDHSPAFLQRIHADKREILYLRKIVWPLRDLLRQLVRDENDFIEEGTRLYLRDVQDHIGQIVETIESYQSMLTSIHEIAVAGMGNQMNQIMKVLTMISTVFIPLTFIVGIYGMNFKFMPELKSPFGYPAVWILMTSIALGIYYYFRKKGWFE